MKDLCIYHGNCADGFSAAWVVWKFYNQRAHQIPGEMIPDNIEFHAGIYQQEPPDVIGRRVYLVDFSYKRPVLLDMANRAHEIIILDHHKSAEEELYDLPVNVWTVFDMERSGAMITWDYFFPDEEPPQLLKHVQDRDLWRFELPGTREIQANLFSYPYDFEVWDALMHMDTHELIRDGEAIERKHHKDIAELIKVTTRRMTIAGYDVPVANLPYTLVSDAAHQLADGEPFAACYWDTPNGRVFGLRSKEDGVDVSAVAKHYGGGGHKHAAGFSVPFEEVEKLEITAHEYQP